MKPTARSILLLPCKFLFHRNGTNLLQRLQLISRLCCYSGEGNVFSKDWKTPPTGKGPMLMSGESPDRHNEN